MEKPCDGGHGDEVGAGEDLLDEVEGGDRIGPEDLPEEVGGERSPGDVLDLSEAWSIPMRRVDGIDDRYTWESEREVASEVKG